MGRRVSLELKTLYNSFLEKTINEWAPEVVEEFVSRYDKEIEAWEKSLVGSYELSGQLHDFVGNHYSENSGGSLRNLESLAAFSYYLSAMSYYLAFKHYNKVECKELSLKELKKAIDLGGNNRWFNNLRAVVNSCVKHESEKMAIDFSQIEVSQAKQDISHVIDSFIDRYTSKTRNWKQTYNELLRMINEGKHEDMIGALLRIFEFLGFNPLKGDSKANEPDLIVFSPSYNWKYILSVEVKTREKGEVEPKKSVSQTLADAGVIERRYKEYAVYPVLITQKEKFDSQAVEVAKGKVSLLRTSVLSNLMQRTFDNIHRWEGLSAKNKASFIESFISAYELKEVFRPKDDPIIERGLFEKI